MWTQPNKENGLSYTTYTSISEVSFRILQGQTNFDQAVFILVGKENQFMPEPTPPRIERPKSLIEQLCHWIGIMPEVDEAETHSPKKMVDLFTEKRVAATIAETLEGHTKLSREYLEYVQLHPRHRLEYVTREHIAEAIRMARATIVEAHLTERVLFVNHLTTDEDIHRFLSTHGLQVTHKISTLKYLASSL